MNPQFHLKWWRPIPSIHHQRNIVRKLWVFPLNMVSIEWVTIFRCDAFKKVSTITMQKHLGYILGLGCLSCISVTKECYQIYESWLGSFFFSYLATVFPWFFSVGTIIFSACQDAGTIRGQEQNEDGVNIARQHMQSRVLARARSATTRGPCCCQLWVQLSQPRSLLRHQLPPLQVL